MFAYRPAAGGMRLLHYPAHGPTAGGTAIRIRLPTTIAPHFDATCVVGGARLAASSPGFGGLSAVRSCVCVTPAATRQTSVAVWFVLNGAGIVTDEAEYVAKFDGGLLAAYQGVDTAPVFTRQCIVQDVHFLRTEVGKLNLALPHGVFPDLVGFAQGLPLA